jgi:hypothetical protein
MQRYIKDVLIVMHLQFCLQALEQPSIVLLRIKPAA